MSVTSRKIIYSCGGWWQERSPYLLGAWMSPKVELWLGLKNFVSQKISVLTQWLWWLLLEPNSPYYKVIRKKHGLQRNGLDPFRSPENSYLGSLSFHLTHALLVSHLTPKKNIQVTYSYTTRLSFSMALLFYLCPTFYISRQLFCSAFSLFYNYCTHYL